MNSRILSAGARTALAASSTPMRSAATTRGFHATTRKLADAVAVPVPVRKPVGAFRGGLFGFLLGTTLAGSGVYGYTLREYKASNELLTEDIYVRYCI
ncbi:hypothetical protein GGR56DRAFT_204393 [Xylariaceae sp. FL0804]|nr:hypothetical protein GGR56DRAFT_204393 [Xylariaceae sp. FL0804]